MVDLNFDGTSAQILIGNDQEWSARSLESVLTPLGGEVSRAFTGHQVIDAALRLRPDLILLDTQLPDIQGYEVCRMLRAENALGAATPIIMTTSGPAGRSQRLEALEAGAWDFLSEPVDVDLLLPRIQNYIAARRAGLRSATFPASKSL